MPRGLILQSMSCALRGWLSAFMCLCLLCCHLIIPLICMYMYEDNSSVAIKYTCYIYLSTLLFHSILLQWYFIQYTEYYIQNFFYYHTNHFTSVYWLNIYNLFHTTLIFHIFQVIKMKPSHTYCAYLFPFLNKLFLTFYWLINNKGFISFSIY